MLLGVLELSRASARGVGPVDIAVDKGVRIRDRTVPVAADPAGCPACAVTRWLRIVGPVWTGFRGEVLQLVDPTQGSLATHDCVVPVLGEWRRAEQLLLPLDVHGWARTGASLSGRSMTAIVPRRRADAAAGRPEEVVGPIIRTPSRVDHLTTQEAYAALGDADDAVDAALARLNAVYAELEHLNENLHAPPPPDN